MKNPLKRISFLCGIAVIMLAAFPVFAQNKPEINRKTLREFTDLVIKNEDEKVLVSATTVSENDKIVTIKTSVEKSVGQEMIQRKLTEELNKRSKQING